MKVFIIASLFLASCSASQDKGATTKVDLSNSEPSNGLEQSADQNTNNNGEAPEADEVVYIEPKSALKHDFAQSFMDFINKDILSHKAPSAQADCKLDLGFEVDRHPASNTNGGEQFYPMKSSLRIGIEILQAGTEVKLSLARLCSLGESAPVYSLIQDSKILKTESLPNKKIADDSDALVIDVGDLAPGKYVIQIKPSAGDMGVGKVSLSGTHEFFARDIGYGLEESDVSDFLKENP